MTTILNAMEKHRPKLVSYVSFILGGNDADAEDVIQDAYTKAWMASDKFRSESGIFTWLYRICMTEALMFLRAKNKSLDTISLEDWHDAPYEPESMEKQMLYEDVLSSLAGLPDIYRTTYTLQLFLGMSAEDIGLLLGVPKNTVQMRIKRAKNFLRSKYENSEYVS